MARLAKSKFKGNRVRPESANNNNNNTGGNSKPKPRQPKKDSRTPRVNYDNTRVDKFEKDITDKNHSKDNDISWYAKNPELMKSAGSIGFSMTAGQPIGLANQFTIPGIYTIGLAPAFGGANLVPLNQSTNSFESFVIHANSRNTSYSGKDLMVLTLAGGNVYSFLAWLTRIYGVMKNYEQVNAYTPKAVLTAMGVDFDDFKDHLADMWFDLNQMIAESAQIWVPSTFPIIARWYWMYSNLYTDGTSAKSQIYFYNPTQFLQFNETAFDTGSALTPALINLTPDQTTANYAIFSPQTRAIQAASASSSPTKGYTYAQVKTVYNNMMQPLLNSTYRGVIFGDILKAYGADKIYGLSEIPVDYKVSPVYNQEVLTQIENAVIAWSTLGSFGLYQNLNKGTLDTFVVSGNDSATTATIIDKTVLNFHQAEQPTPEQIMIATRLHTNGFSRTPVKKSYPSTTTGEYSALTDGYDVLPYSTGSEIALNAYAYGYEQGKLRGHAVGGIENTSSYASSVINSSAFDWSPLIYVGSSANQQKEVYTQAVYGDIDNAVVVDRVDVYKLHNCALYSEFDVPQM